MYTNKVRIAAVVATFAFQHKFTMATEEIPYISKVRQAESSPIYLVESDRGILAKSLNGKLNKTLVPGPICSAIYDAGTEVLFFPRDHRLWVLDLREPQPRPQVVAEWPAFQIRKAGPAKRECMDYGITMPDGANMFTSPDIVWVLNWKTERVAGETRNNYKVVGSWLRTQAERPVRKREKRQQLSPTQPTPFGNTQFSFVYMKKEELYSRDEVGFCLLKEKSGKLRSPESLALVSELRTNESNCHVAAGYSIQFNDDQRAWYQGLSVCDAKKCIPLQKGERFIGWLDPGPEFILTDAWRFYESPAGTQ